MTPSPAVPTKSAVAGVSKEAIFNLLESLVKPLASALGPNAEVVLHDLGRIPNSVVAVGGSITGRGPGSPSTDVMLRELRAGKSDHLIGYQSRSNDGKLLRSSSLFLRDAEGEPFGCLCINTDISGIATARDLLGALASTTDLGLVTSNLPVPAPSETFPATVEELAAGALRTAIDEVQIPAELMRKTHKLAVIGQLEQQGFFQIRDSVDMAAAALHVSRYTIYNYLHELHDGELAEDR